MYVPLRYFADRLCIAFCFCIFTQLLACEFYEKVLDQRFSSKVDMRIHIYCGVNRFSNAADFKKFVVTFQFIRNSSLRGDNVSLTEEALLFYFGKKIKMKQKEVLLFSSMGASPREDICRPFLLLKLIPNFRRNRGLEYCENKHSLFGKWVRH